ncbi:hypothetical protein M6D93_14965 [Jatrophihabitans telluris]|uniref:AMIN-like domain-containing protein n=1 Tax=Jatrophihabitans telluris TaxID=2038343 RepID=A0ABY4QVW9_9ACTN|nr:hypothetical protein [Jatrophihabitans telluris]UQX87593.1 hypothetical protein M6D93_14965 [Jatrophihabitans telluris]
MTSNSTVPRRIGAGSAALIALAAAIWVAVLPQPAAALPAYVCGTVSGGSSSVSAHVVDVRVGQHVGFDRFVVQFAGSKIPSFTLTPKSSAVFYLDGSGKPVTLRGTAGLKVVMRSTTGIGTFSGPTDIRPAFVQLREARQIGDFEGVTSWGLGLAHQSCKRVFTLTGPTRLVIDLPH